MAAQPVDGKPFSFSILVSTGIPPRSETAELPLRFGRDRYPLADFGMATREDDSQIFKCGTLAFMSPDLWALGVILLTLVTITLPWGVADLSDPKYAAFRADENKYFMGVFHLAQAANDVFRWCFAADAVYRPTLPQLRAAVLNIERFSLAEMLPPSPVEKPSPVAEDLPMLNLSPSLFTGSAPPSTAIADLLDAANVGLAMPFPPLVPTRLYTHSSSSSSSSIVLLLPPPVKMAPGYRFLNRKKRDIATRQRFADKLHHGRIRKLLPKITDDGRKGGKEREKTCKMARKR
ncbi:hypothetical protein DFH09DRAFT_1329246 [Mycena vulgaris]|nr:hypothetical protein DFH09DRAFT_1329246 [Mycena vulgaris]